MLGGFVDGIALHQVAQWHSMLSAKVPPTSLHAMMYNMRADGWFHAAVILLTLAGILDLYLAARRSALFPPMRWFSGLLLVGWGMLNLVEGVINHHLLQLHHVRDLPVHVPAYDYVFLLVGGLASSWSGGCLREARCAPAPSPAMIRHVDADRSGTRFPTATTLAVHSRSPCRVWASDLPNAKVGDGASTWRIGAGAKSRFDRFGAGISRFPR